MENHSEPHGKSRKDQAPTVIVTALAALAVVALGAIVFSARPTAASTPIRLPAQVTPANCAATARHAGIYAKDMTAKRLGEYYAAWVGRFEQHVGEKVLLTRTNLFDAGLAVAVCLR